MFEKGKNNINWNGGVSEYSNHAKLKKQRLIVLKNSKGKCEICGKQARIVHHIDGSLSNHSIDNLISLCNPCHRAVHQEDLYGAAQNGGRTSKFIRIYGITLQEMALKYGGTSNRYSQLHQEGKLKQRLETLRKNKA